VFEAAVTTATEARPQSAPATNGRHSATGRRIGFVSTRLAGTDGVSLEARKWADVLVGAGHHCFYFAGECDHDAQFSHRVPEAAFSHPAVAALGAQAFSPDLIDLNQPDRPDAACALPTEAFAGRLRSTDTTRRIRALASHLKAKLYAYVRGYDLELLIVENALAIPMNLPLGLALTELIAETGLPTIAHHHDFYWERKRFQVGCVSDYLEQAFPPRLPSIRHVVINSLAAQQLAWRKGLSSVLIPNVMDFDRPPAAGNGQELRRALGFAPDELFVLQPTRVIQRKGIEHALELVQRLGRPARLVISHASGDEGQAYARRVREYADMLGVRLMRVEALIGAARSGAQPFSLADCYAAADLVTYPSLEEGFGNAFLEAVYHGRPLVVNKYLVYAVDIEPKGFRVVAFEDFQTDDTVRQAEQVMADPALAQAWAETNYALGRQHYSYAVLEQQLRRLVGELLGEA
jgi:mannosylglucosylglycerate synthase